MEYILFNNIGNRHLRYKGEEINKKKFKDLTKEYWENYEQVKDNLSVEIISDYLKYDNNYRRFKKVVLFATLQGDIEKSTQDTYFSALLIQKKLGELYPDLEIEIEKITVNPSDENLLLSEYISIFKKYSRQYPSSQWYFLDAGGTSQQKLVCKLLFPLLKNKVKVEYLSHIAGWEKDKIKLEERNQKTLELLLLKKTILDLVKDGYYSSALKLLAKAEPKNKAIPFLKLGANKMNNVFKDISGEFPDRLARKDEFLKSYFFQNAVINFPELEENLEKEDYFRVGEFFSRAHFYYSRGFYDQFVLSFQQTLEVLLLSFIYFHAKRNGVDEKKEKFVNKIDTYLKKYWGDEKIYGGLSYQLKFALEVTQGKRKLQEFFEMFSSINNAYRMYIAGEKYPDESTLDAVRNKLVHEGKSVTEYLRIKTIKNKLGKPFEKMISEEFLNLRTDVFDKINDWVREYII